jgi:hypothetical protein
MGKEAKYIVRLTDEERHTLQQVVVGRRVARGQGPAGTDAAEGRCRWP